MRTKKQKGTTKRKTWNHVVAILIGLLIGFVCGIPMGRFINNPSAQFFSTNNPLLLWIAALLLLYAVLFLQIIIHEAGHLIAGLCSGYTFLSFRVGNLMWIKDQGKIKLRRLSVAGTGGQCLMNPPDLIDGKMPYVFYNLGGSLMNLLTVPLFGVLFVLFKDRPLLSLFSMMMCIIGLGYALLNGLPLKTCFINNDGSNTIELGKSPEALKSLWVQMKVSEQLVQGVRLKDMPQEWFVLPDEGDMKNSMVATMAVFYENRLLDELAFEEVKPLIDRLLSTPSGIIEIHRNLLICDRIYCELIGENDKSLIDKLYTKNLIKFMKQMHTFPSVIRTQYAYALLSNHDVEKASLLAKQFEKCAKKHPYPSDIESERELMEIAAQKYSA